LAFIDHRQFHAGHTLVIPRKHLVDVRHLDETIGAALIAAVSRLARAVSAVFPNQGLSIWHSIGRGADQEAPHPHFHVHPRMIGDGLLRVYPSLAPVREKAVRDSYAVRLRSHWE
jgi:histidine triad (HIT) family protein